MRLIYLLCLFILGANAEVQAAPQTWQVQPSASRISVSGTSSLHDWTMQASPSQGVLILEDDQLKSLKLVIPVRSLQSEHEMMNEKTYEALQAKTYPDITFQADEWQRQSESLAIKAGQLSLHGVTRKISIAKLQYESTKQQLSLRGSYVLNMKEFSVEPPSVLFMTVGETVTVNVHLVFAKADKIPSSQK